MPNKRNLIKLLRQWNGTHKTNAPDYLPRHTLTSKWVIGEPKRNVSKTPANVLKSTFLSHVTEQTNRNEKKRNMKMENENIYKFSNRKCWIIRKFCMHCTVVQHASTPQGTECRDVVARTNEKICLMHIIACTCTSFKHACTVCQLPWHVEGNGLTHPSVECQHALVQLLCVPLALFI